MDFLFGFGLAFIVVGGLPIVLLLGLGFVYARAQRGHAIDIDTGITAYTSLLTVIAAVVVAVGVSFLARAIMGGIDADYTYGFAFDQFDGSGPIDPQDRDIARGVGLIVVGAVMLALHIAIRTKVATNNRLDRGAEGFIEVSAAIILALTVLVIAAQVLQNSLERAINDDVSIVPGSAIAFFWGFAPLWAAYGYRAFVHYQGHQHVVDDE